MICANTRQVSVKKEKKRYLHFIKKNTKKRKEKKESKMRIKTELVGEKVPENKSCLAFCKVYYLPQGQIFRIIIYIYIYIYKQEFRLFRSNH